MAATTTGNGGSSATRRWRRRGTTQLRPGLITTVVALVADREANSTRGRAWRRRLSVVSLFLVCALMSVLPASPTNAQSAPTPGLPGSPFGSMPAPEVTSPPATPLTGPTAPDSAERARVGAAMPTPPVGPLPGPTAADPAELASVLAAIPAPPGYRAGVELMERRTETSKTFAGDRPGELKTELYAGAKHFKDAKGAWVDIDTELGASKDGKRQNKANTFVLTVADSAADGALASVALDAQHSVGFSLEGAAKVTAIADKSSVTYPRTHNDTDVRLTSVHTGVKEELVLHSGAAPDRFVFPLELKGLTAALNEGGDVVYRDGAGAERARTPHGFMTDANVDARSGQAPTSRGVTYALIPHGNGLAIEVRLDRAWLDDPARAYPVTVDPEIKTGAGADDTFASSLNTTWDHSYATALNIGTYNSGGDRNYGYVRFDTTPLNGAVIEWAALVMSEQSSWDCSRQPGPVYRVTSDWNGRTLNWNNKPPVDPRAYAGVMAGMNPCPTRSGVWEIRDMVAHWAANPTQSFGLSIRSANDWDNLAWKTWYTTDAGGPPRLDVTYNHRPADPSEIQPLQYGDYGRAAPPYLNTLSAKYSDPNGTPGQVIFRLLDYPAGNQVGPALWSAPVCSGCRASVALPPLAEAWYLLSAISYDGKDISPAWTASTLMFYDTHAPDTPTDVIPAAGAVVSNPITVSGRYSEFWGWGGYLLFVVNNTAGQQVTAVWKPLPKDPEDPTDQLCSGCVGTTTLPNLANGTYDVLTYAYDGGLSAPVVRRITVIDGPTTTTSSSTTTSSTTTVPPTTTSSSTTTMVPPTTTTTLPPTTTTAPTSSTSTSTTSSTSTTTSTTLPPPGVPSEPTSITVSDPVRRNGAGEVTVSWTPPSDLRGSEIIGYTILPSDNCTCTGIHVTDTSTSSSRLTGLALGVTYRFRVQASSNHGPGDISALSDQVTINPPVVRVMTWNLQRGIENSPFGPVVRAGIGVWAGKIREHRVQVVGLQEVTHDQAYDLASELGWYAYYKTTEAPCGDVFAEFPPECVPFGNAILSEFPFTAEDEAFEDLPNSREEAPGERKLLRIKVVIEGVQFHFYSTHLAAHPVGNTEEGDFDRNTQANAVVSMTEVDRQAAESGGGGLPYRGAVLGDFNSSPDDDASETMGASFVDAWDDLYERYDPAGYTSNARTGLRQRIDYIYVSRAHPWPVLAVTVDPEVLSDHLAVIAEL